MVSFDEFARELRAFDAKREVVNELRKELRKPLPELRKAVRANAIATLPSGGGLGAWVAKAAMSVRFKDAGRSAGISLKLSRKSSQDKADLVALDERGVARHPVYGNRSKWVSQRVPAGFFTKVWEAYRDRWIKAADDALDRALDKIRGG